MSNLEFGIWNLECLSEFQIPNSEFHISESQVTSYTQQPSHHDR